MKTSCRKEVLVLLFAAGTSCRDHVSALPEPPAAIAAVSSLPATAIVGSAVPTPAVVAVTDAEGRPVSGVPVLFAVSVGNGSVSPASARTDADGRASTHFTLGTIAGVNQVTASVAGVSGSVRLTTTGVAGPAELVTLGPRLARFPVGTDSLRVTATTFDAFGNRVNQATVLLQARDTTLLTVDDAGYAHVRRRGGLTYLVASTATRADSVLAVVLAPGDSPCTAVADGRTLSLGEVLTDVAAGGFCVRAGGADEEFVLVPYFSSSVPGGTVQIQVQGSGVGVAEASPSASVARVASTAFMATASDLRDRFELALRRLEHREMPKFADGARAWQASRRRDATGGRAPLAPSLASIPANAAIGDLVRLNTNANEYCTNPTLRTARVVAMSQRAVVVADTSNPVNGFTDAEYASVAATFDTLVSVTDIEAFGEPSDIDSNGRVVIFFTRAVNELTPRGSSSVILGFYFSRDLLPSTGQGSCAGSNVGEMFYLLVPDPSGAASDPRSHAFVLSVSNGTVAHEYQHLINASRRLYVNHAPEVNEETWLNEGLSHIAEELVFYRATRFGPRQNLGGGILADPAVLDAYRTYQSNNLRRYAAYLRSTALQAPVGLPGDDDLETRGAAWSFLRYLADRVAPGDRTFWFRLVNSQTIGVTNLRAVLGQDIAPLQEDWAVSLYADEAAPAVDARFVQPSWDFRTLFPAAGSVFPLTDPSVERRLADGGTSNVTLRGGGAGFLRFVVPAQREALLLVSSGGQPPPASIRLAVVRIR